MIECNHWLNSQSHFMICLWTPLELMGLLVFATRSFFVLENLHRAFPQHRKTRLISCSSFDHSTQRNARMQCIKTLIHSCNTLEFSVADKSMSTMARDSIAGNSSEAAFLNEREFAPAAGRFPPGRIEGT